MAAKFNVIHDTRFTVPDQGNAYMHCGKCLKEMPSGVSPKDYARQQAAITKEGFIQVWCTRHDCNISLMKIEAKADGAIRVNPRKGKGDGA